MAKLSLCPIFAKPTLLPCHMSICFYTLSLSNNKLSLCKLLSSKQCIVVVLNKKVLQTWLFPHLVSPAPPPPCRRDPPLEAPLAAQEAGPLFCSKITLSVGNSSREVFPAWIGSARHGSERRLNCGEVLCFHHIYILLSIY